MKKCNFIVSIVGAVMGAAILFLSAELRIGLSSRSGIRSGTWPGMIGVLMLLVSGILFAVTLLKGKELEKMEIALAEDANKRVYIVIGIMIAFCALLDVIGLYAAGALMIPPVMMLLGERGKVKIAVVTVATLVAVFLIFEVILKTQMPRPFFI